MPIDASIYQNVLTPQMMQQQQYRNELLQYQAQQAQRQMQVQNSMMQMFRQGANPMSMTPGQQSQIWGLDPQLGMKMQQANQLRQLQQSEIFKNVSEGHIADMRMQQAQQAKFGADLLPIKQAALLTYQDTLQKSGDPKLATQDAQQVYAKGVQGLPTGAYGPDMLQQAMQEQFNPNLWRAQIYGKDINSASVKGNAPPVRTLYVGGDKEQQQQWDPATRSWKSIGPSVPRFKPRTVINVGNNASKGWEMFYNPDDKKNYRINPNAGIYQQQQPDGSWKATPNVDVSNLKKVGGSNSGFGSAMNQRFVNRVSGAGNEGAAALISIAGMDHPDSGLFSFSSVAGANGKSVTAGLLTPGRIKEYNATIAGLAPEIATAQNQGMAPNDAQIQAVEQALTIGPTDNLQTSQYRVALGARYLRKALEVSQTLGTPDQKKQIAGIMKELSAFPDPNAILRGDWQKGRMFKGAPMTTSPQQEGAPAGSPAGTPGQPVAPKGVVTTMTLMQYAKQHRISPQAAAQYLKGLGYDVR